VDKFGVGAYGNDFCTQLFKLLILLRQSSKLGCSDKGKVGRVKKENRPFLGGFQPGKTDFREISLGGIKCIKFEIGNALTNPDTAAITRHVQNLRR
jgi:hypothetical protein